MYVFFLIWRKGINFLKIFFMFRQAKSLIKKQYDQHGTF
ncbi:hypothetical protein N824_04705 [Pedobacter sp. V48]|nr:hypothetical protein N824_04705 [Pedobacter sp. V48]